MMKETELKPCPFCGGEANVKGFTEQLSRAKAEAIKEFAEKIKTDAERICDDNYIERALIEYIDNLVKEMTEEKTKI